MDIIHEFLESKTESRSFEVDLNCVQMQVTLLVFLPVFSLPLSWSHT